MSGVFTEEELNRYREEGFVVKRNLFSDEEITLLGESAHSDHALDQAGVAPEYSRVIFFTAVMVEFGLI